MKTLSPFVALVVFVFSSCSVFEGPAPVGVSRNSASGGKSTGRGGYSLPDSLLRRDTLVYTCGIEFPPDYDWIRDTARGNVSCSLVLMAEGCRLEEIPAGPGTYISPDPDMNHLRDGHVYSEYASKDETIISRDGKEIFRYKGREKLRGIMVREDTVFTLGQNRAGAGLSLRRNGKVLYAKDDGFVAGGLYDAGNPSGALQYEGGPCFFYYTSAAAKDGERKAWHAVRKESAVDIALPEGAGTIYDLRYHEGILYVAASMEQYNSSLVLCHGNRKVALAQSITDKVAYCRILSGGSRLLVKAEILGGGADSGNPISGNDSHCIWNPDGTPAIDKTTLPVYDYYPDGDRVGYLSGRGLVVTNAWNGMRRFRMPPGYRLMNPFCASLDEGNFSLALSPENSGGKARLWRNGRLSDLDFGNGYLVGINVIY